MEMDCMEYMNRSKTSYRRESVCFKPFHFISIFDSFEKARFEKSPWKSWTLEVDSVKTNHSDKFTNSFNQVAKLSFGELQTLCYSV